MLHPAETLVKRTNIKNFLEFNLVDFEETQEKANPPGVVPATTKMQV